MLTRSTFPGAGPSLLRLDKHSRPLCWAPRGHVSGRFMNARWPGANTPLWCTHLHAFSGGLLGVRLPGSQVWEGQPPPPARGLHLPTPGAGAWRTFAEERVEECLRGTRGGASPGESALARRGWAVRPPAGEGGILGAQRSQAPARRARPTSGPRRPCPALAGLPLPSWAAGSSGGRRQGSRTPVAWRMTGTQGQKLNLDKGLSPPGQALPPPTAGTLMGGHLQGQPAPSAPGAPSWLLWPRPGADQRAHGRAPCPDQLVLGRGRHGSPRQG